MDTWTGRTQREARVPLGNGNYARVVQRGEKRFLTLGGEGWANEVEVQPAALVELADGSVWVAGEAR